MARALDKISREFRSAILGADHVLAGQLALEYAGALREFWESLPESERSSSSIPQQVSELLSWAHGMTVIQRTMVAEQLAAIQTASRYNAARSAETPRPAVQLLG